MAFTSALRENLTKKLIRLQAATDEHPYSITHRLDLAKAYKGLGYPDLAAGDAYKALLLIDELVDEGEYHEEALEAAKDDYVLLKTASLVLDEEKDNVSNDSDGVLQWARTECSNIAYDVLVSCLLDCGDLRSAFEYISRARTAFPDNTTFELHNANLTEQARSYSGIKGGDFNDKDIDDYPNKGLVRREQYPWNRHEPDRVSNECLQILNNELARIAPKLEVKVSELPSLSGDHPVGPSASEVTYVKQLGVFAKQDISPSDQILEEKSLLTAIARLHDSYCDACSLALPDCRDNHDLIQCEECGEVFFCSTECHDLAQDSYHPSVCGIDVDQPKVSASEAADSLYTSLLIRALALAETQDLHPLDLKELRYIWGDYHGLDLSQSWRVDSNGQLTDPFGHVPQTLPFSFKANFLTPLHMLEKMGVNIYTQGYRYDTWVFNTIYAKLRGTASAKQGLDGRPEIGAVHPMWCLANHSCDPNVSWEWQGNMRFWARTTLVNWPGRDPAKGPGIKKGEEVFGHYCDVRLPVKERREWAVGALGGECVCPRCVWEAAMEHDKLFASQ